MQFNRFLYIAKLDILVVKFSIIEKSGSDWKNIIRNFYNGLIGSIISSSIDIVLIQLIKVNNLESIKRKALLYQKKIMKKCLYWTAKA